MTKKNWQVKWAIIDGQREFNIDHIYKNKTIPELFLDIIKELGKDRDKLDSLSIELKDVLLDKERGKADEDD